MRSDLFILIYFKQCLFRYIPWFNKNKEKPYVRINITLLVETVMKMLFILLEE